MPFLARLCNRCDNRPCVPACVESCVGGARMIGDVKDSNSQDRSRDQAVYRYQPYKAAYKGDALGNLHKSQLCIWNEEVGATMR